MHRGYPCLPLLQLQRDLFRFPFLDLSASILLPGYAWYRFTQKALEKNELLLFIGSVPTNLVRKMCTTKKLGLEKFSNLCLVRSLFSPSRRTNYNCSFRESENPPKPRFAGAFFYIEKNFRTEVFLITKQSEQRLYWLPPFCEYFRVF
jgi:hypothetical protein